MTTPISHKRAMKDRIDAKTKYIQARIAELKADVTTGAAGELDRLQSALGDLREAAKKNFDDLSESAAKKVNQLLDRTPG